MNITIKDIYDLKCAILRTLYPGRVDRSDRLQIYSYSYNSENGEYLCFESGQIRIILRNDNTVQLCSLSGRKSLVFTHSNFNNTIETITTELAAIRG
jgi:hypothetical protein